MIAGKICAIKVPSTVDAHTHHKAMHKAHEKQHADAKLNEVPNQKKLKSQLNQRSVLFYDQSALEVTHQQTPDQCTDNEQA